MEPSVPRVDVRPAPPLDAARRHRYARHLLLPGIGEEGQRRLLGARVLVVGAGGLGSPALLYLAAAGVGTLGVVDDDRVDLSNLQRQVLHGTDAVGEAKTASAAERLRGLNPDVAVIEHRVRLTEANATELLSGYHVVLDGSDNFATRYLVSDACERLGIPEVWGSVLRFDGEVAVFWPPHGPAYRDLHPDPPPEGAVPSCSDVGVSGALCGTIGSLMAAEAVKLVTGHGRPLIGRLLVHDSAGGSFRELRVRPDPRRPRHADAPPDGAPAGGPDLGGPDLGGPDAESPDVAVPDTDPLDTGRLAQLPLERIEALARRGEIVLVDVREPAEVAALRLSGAIAVPLEDFADPDVVGRLIERAAGRPLVAVCPVGRRSAAAARVLRAAGAGDATHVEGGIHAWLTGRR